MKYKIITLLLATTILVGDGGVLAYAGTSHDKTTIQKEAQNAYGYETPEIEVSDFALGERQTKQLTVPALTISSINPETMQEVSEIINPTVNYIVSDTNVISVSADGTVTGNAAGTTNLTIEYSYIKDNIYLCGNTVSVNVDVTDASLSNKDFKININGIVKSQDKSYDTDQYVTIDGMSDLSNVEIIPSSSDIMVEQSGHDFYFSPKKTGDYTVTFVVDGKSLKCNVSVLNLSYTYNSKSVTDVDYKDWTDETMVALSVGESTTLKAKGFPKNEKVVWKSSDKSVATVSKNGVIKAKKIGYTTISASAHGFTITYKVGVSYKSAIKAMRYAVKHYKSIYSQPKRMQKGYYDCSSYVWRSYKEAGFNIGNSKTGWAPVAAELARWSVSNKYMVYSGTVKVDDLLPGDLIFWTGSDNGRYQGIYHVDMYVGNHHSLTVAREKAFGDTISNCMVARPNTGTKVSTLKASQIKKSGKKAIKLSWSSCYQAKGYKVYRSTKEKGKYKKIAIVRDGRVYNDTKIKSGKKYYYKIVPYWRAGKKTYNGKTSQIVSKKLK